MSSEKATDGTMIEQPGRPTALALTMHLMRAEDQLRKATELGQLLAKTVRQAGFVSRISGKDYVQVEGWQLLAQLMGVTNCQTEVAHDPSGNSVATCYLYVGEEMVGRATAVCGIDEVDWKDKAQNHRDSMAQTRAYGKACRLKWGFIMAQGGFSATPAEEMPPRGKPGPKPRSQASQAKGVNTNQPEQAGMPDSQFQSLLGLVASCTTTEALQMARDSCTSHKHEMSNQQRKLAGQALNEVADLLASGGEVEEEPEQAPDSSLTDGQEFL